MRETTVEEIISIVSSIFDVRAISRTVNMMHFKIEDDDFKQKFVDLARILEPKNISCRLESLGDGMYIMVTKFPARKQGWLSKSWIPRLLFGIVITFVMIDGYYRTQGVNQITFIGEPLEMAAIYTLSLLGILGIHELGHLAASRWHKIKTTWPYFIPGIPIYGIPTFGAFIQSRGLTVNREILFDIAIAGPIAGLIITILVSMYGAYTAPIIPIETAESLYQNNMLIQWNQGEPLLMSATLAMFGKGGQGHEVLLTPVMFAAWIGFLITFLNLLPAWQLDGGHMARTLFGKRWHKYATYASMGVLVLLGYWIMAMFILILSSRNPEAQPLDDISPLSTNRKIAYIGVVILAILCAPLPASFLS